MKKWMWIMIGAVVVMAAIGLVVAVRQSRSANSNLRTVTAERRTVTQDVTFTGRLSPATVSNISFELPGTVTNIFVAEGEAVAAGQALVVLDTSSVALEVAEAHATTVSAQTKAQLALNEAREEQKQTATVNSETITKRRQSVVDTKEELDQAKKVHEQRARESGDDTTLTETAIAGVRAAETAYHAAQTTLDESLATVAQSNASAAAAATAAEADYLATVQAARGIAGLSTLQAQERIVANKLSKHTLTAPFNGTVTVRHKNIGEAALAGQPVITVATVEQLELEATATETDAIKIAVGLPASVTFDALPTTQQWTARVNYLSPAAEIVDGVPLYTVKLTLNEPAQSLRAGLTANVTVHAAARENVFAVPRRAVTLRDEKEFVSILGNDGAITEKEVTTGLLGSDGSVEIRAGLSGGERVIINPGEISRDNDTPIN